MICERLQTERKRLQKQFDSIQSQLKKLPDGKLICARNENRYKWYHSDGKTKTYIPKKQRKYAEKLAVKKYLTELSGEIQNEIKAIDSYLHIHNSNPRKSQQLLTDSRGYQELLSPYFKPCSEELEIWKNSPYEHNTKYPEHLIHKTSFGNLVRSKSEALIDALLYTNNIPFRYECALHLGDTTLYPDFTILHPETGKIYYWEHFGRMDDPAYSKNVYPKLQLYNSYGIIPSIQLITTFETKENPLSSEVIEKIIEHYFL